jgi:hypothetical protein
MASFMALWLSIYRSCGEQFSLVSGNLAIAFSGGRGRLVIALSLWVPVKSFSRRCSHIPSLAASELPTYSASMQGERDQSLLI